MTPDSSRLKPISARKTVHDLVYEQLRDALMSGAFDAREALTIAALSERFQTSHMPVREALRRLVSENALQVSASGTARVPGIIAAELEDLTRARIIAEGATAAIAGPRLTPADIARLEDLLTRHRAASSAGDIDGMARINRAFHFQIYRAAGSPVLLSQIENLWLRSGPYVRFLSQRMRTLLGTGRMAGFTGHHAEMIAAAKAGDWPGFRAAMEADIAAAGALLLRDLREEET